MAVGSGVFPYQRSVRGYIACNRSYSVSRCPFSARLRTQLAGYAGNAAGTCPQGCTTSGLISRVQCGSWSHESVTESIYLVASIALSGGACSAMTYYIPVVMENNRVVADDVWCGQEAVAFGMYNYSANATGGLSCSFP